MLELYGSPMSSAGRSLWMIEEVGVPYQYTHVDLRDGSTRTPEFLARYGAGTVPVLVDGELTLGESMAINFYLAERYKPELLPSAIDDRARAYQWSFWAITLVQPRLLTLMFNAMKPEAERSQHEAEHARTALEPQLAHLEAALTGHDYLVADRFGIADINAGSVMNIGRAIGVVGSSHPNISAWMDRLRARPAFQKLISRG